MKTVFAYLLGLLFAQPLLAQVSVFDADPPRVSSPIRHEMVAATTIQFDSTEFDWGEYREGEQGVKYIWFTNTGNEVAEIRVKGSGGNVLPCLEDQYVKPGERGRVRVDFLTNGKVGMTTNTFYVYCNAVDQNAIRIQVKFRVVTDPSRIDPSSVAQPKPHSQTLGQSGAPEKHTPILLVPSPWGGDSVPATTIKFDTTHIDLGTVVMGQCPTAQFWFTNVGEHVAVVRVHGSGGPTHPCPADYWVKPGERGYAQICLNSAGADGTRTKTFTVHYNQADHKPIVLYLKFNVVRDIAPPPQPEVPSQLVPANEKH